MKKMTVQIEVSDGIAIWKSRVLIFENLERALVTVVDLLAQAWHRFQKVEEEESK